MRKKSSYYSNVSIPYKYTFNVYNRQDITEILLKVVLSTIKKSVFIEVLIPCGLTVGMTDMLFSDKEMV